MYFIEHIDYSAICLPETIKSQIKANKIYLELNF